MFSFRLNMGMLIIWDETFGPLIPAVTSCKAEDEVATAQSVTACTGISSDWDVARQDTKP